MKGRNPNAEEKRHMTAVRELGCIACFNMGIETPPEFTLIHHTDGKTKPNAHLKTLPLCDNHHSPYQLTGLHNNTFQWEKIHGTQEELLVQVATMLDA